MKTLLLLQSCVLRIWVKTSSTQQLCYSDVLENSVSCDYPSLAWRQQTGEVLAWSISNRWSISLALFWGLLSCLVCFVLHCVALCCFEPHMVQCCVLLCVVLCRIVLFEASSHFFFCAALCQMLRYIIVWRVVRCYVTDVMSLFLFSFLFSQSASCSAQKILLSREFQFTPRRLEKD